MVDRSSENKAEINERLFINLNRLKLDRNNLHTNSWSLCYVWQKDPSDNSTHLFLAKYSFTKDDS